MSDMRKIDRLYAFRRSDITIFVYALCDDGTLWRLANPEGLGENQPIWVRMPDIPQDRDK